MFLLKGLREPKIHKCMICGKGELDIERVNKKLFICHNCITTKFDYESENDLLIGNNGIKNKYSLSIELETNCDIPAHKVLISHNWLPTYDASIDGTEYKSPIFADMYSLRKHLNLLFKYVKPCDIVSSHIHIGYPNGDRRLVYQWMDYLNGSPNYTKFIDYLSINRRKLRNVFGRYPNEYASLDYVDSKYHWINTLHYSTVEFRLPRFRHYKQAFELIKMLLRWCKHVELKGKKTINSFLISTLNITEGRILRYEC